jgi:hypothetical protein
MSTSASRPLQKPSAAHNLFSFLESPEVLLRVALVLIGAAYLQAVGFGYVYDDHQLIAVNPWMDSWHFATVIFRKSCWQFMDWKRITDYYRPLVMLLFLSIRRIAGPAPGWFHLVVIGIHLIATGLTYSMLRRLTKNASLAALSAAIFGLHPSRVESVAWISGVSDSLCLVFFLASAILFFRYETSCSKRDWILSAVFLFLGILSKEVLILAPIVFALYCFMRSEGALIQRVRRSLIAIVPHLVVTTGALVARMLVLRHFTGPGANYKAHPLESLYTAPEVMLWYVRQQVWPQTVSVHYPVLVVTHFSWIHFALPAIAVIAIFGMIAFAVRRSPAGILLFAWALLTIAPVIVYHIGIQVHDRYGYLPSLSASAGIAYVLLKVLKNRPIARGTCIAALLIAMASFTFLQARYWKDDITLFEHAVKVAYNHADAYAGLVNAYGMAQQKDKQMEAAQQWVQKAARKQNGWIILSAVYLTEQDTVRAREAWQQGAPELRDAVKFYALGNVEMAENNCVAAEISYRRAIADYPLVAELHWKLYQALACQHRLSEAKEELQRSKQIMYSDVF